MIDINNFFDNDVIMSLLVTNFDSSTAQDIVNWVTTADRCAHSADTTQLTANLFRLVETRQLVQTADATELDS